MPATKGIVLTIGHSTHPIEAFIALLQRTARPRGDVRAAPYSRFTRSSTGSRLRPSLAARGSPYVFLGSELGGRSADPACYDDGRISYERLGATQAFRQGTRPSASGSASRRIVLMCAEKEPLECHRCLLVAPALEAAGRFRGPYPA